MAAFPYYQRHPFLPDSFHLPGFNTVAREEEEVNDFKFTTAECSKFHPFQQGSERIGTGSSDNGTWVMRKQSTESSSVENTEQPSQKRSVAANKRRKPKDGRESTSKKQKKGEAEKVKREAKVEKKEDKAEPPTGYIHVRARRGQATDSHSLAERVRREKISQRMRTLQKLVPGCDKVTGKALMLDEIINYVQSLQTQVEFLSMKLASLHPLFCDFPADVDGLIFRPEGLVGMESNLPQEQQYGSMAFTTSATNNFASSPAVPIAYPFLDTQNSLLLAQDNGNTWRGGEEEKHEFVSLHPSDLSNMYSFH